jgi:phosphoribosylformimino-5-aminoimidazole carboxamide ribotide isomerase
MNLYPAIDMLGGKAVRLTKGDFDAKKVYDEDPFSAASEWVQAGAKRLHVVDLDGAKAGSPANLDHVERIVKELGVPVQLGGGLRSLSAIENVFAIGVERAILGTAAFTEETLLGEALARWPGKVLVSVDVRGGRVATAGWTETIDGGPREIIAELAARGARELLYTNVDRDGMLEGPDLQEVARVAEAVGAGAEAASGSFVYSGGIGSLADLEGLASLRAPALSGVIVGKALYERRFTIPQAQLALGE